MKNLTLTVLFFCVSLQLFAQTPEVLFYKFEGSGTKIVNGASNPPSGTDTAEITGGIVQNVDGRGTCGKSIRGRGVSTSTDYVNTGWHTDLSGSWTMAFTIDSTPNNTTLYYILGDPNLSSFRCFNNGVAGNGNLMLRGPVTDVLAYGGAPTNTLTTTVFVHDSVAMKIYAYVNGTLVNTVSQGALPGPSSGTLLVGAGSSTGLGPGQLMSDFRFYNRALDSSEVSSLTCSGSSCTMTYDTISPSVCDTYTSPSGNYSWTTSGTYMDTIPNAANCDSVITVNLTINNATYDTITQTAIDTFFLNNGSAITNNGTYSDTISNDAGCDSITTYYLTITNRVHVDAGITTSGNGNSWSTAFKTLDEALECVNMCNSNAEIWVKAGTYKPNNVVGVPRNSSFLITNINTKMYGGFAGTETSLDQRNPANNETILSGDIGIANDSSDNAFHVLIIFDKRPVTGGEEVLNSDFLVDGFTIRDAVANGSGRYPFNGLNMYQFHGGGLVIFSEGVNRQVSPAISNCTFTNNFATYGGAMFTQVKYGSSAATITNCIFKNNRSVYGTVCNDGSFGNITSTYSKCVFDNNTCLTSGGGIYNSSYGGICSPTIVNCVFNNNTAANGAGVYNIGYKGTCSPAITNCTFNGNNATFGGGAMYNFGVGGTCTPNVKNCIFYNNQIAGNSSEFYSEFYNQSATLTVQYSMVQLDSVDYQTLNFNSLNSGSGNKYKLNATFVSSTDGDGSDNVWRTSDDGLMIQSSSPAANSGTNSGAPSDDILDKGANGTRDMGAYEYGGTTPAK